MKREHSLKAKLYLYLYIYILTVIPLVTGFWQVTERIRSQIEATEMSLLLRVSGLILRDTVRILTISKKFRVEQLIRCIKRKPVFSVPNNDYRCLLDPLDVF